MGFLLKLLLTLVLIVGILIVLVGSTWVLSLQLNELLEVDVLWKLKRKARKLVYGETVGGMFKRRESGDRSNRSKAMVIKRAIFQRRNNRKKIQIQPNNSSKKG